MLAAGSKRLQDRQDIINFISFNDWPFIRLMPPKTEAAPHKNPRQLSPFSTHWPCIGPINPDLPWTDNCNGLYSRTIVIAQINSIPKANRHRSTNKSYLPNNSGYEVRLSWMPGKWNAGRKPTKRYPSLPTSRMRTVTTAWRKRCWRITGASRRKSNWLSGKN